MMGTENIHKVDVEGVVGDLEGWRIQGYLVPRLETRQQLSDMTGPDWHHELVKSCRARASLLLTTCSVCALHLWVQTGLRRNRLPKVQTDRDWWSHTLVLFCLSPWLKYIHELNWSINTQCFCALRLFNSQIRVNCFMLLTLLKEHFYFELKEIVEFSSLLRNYSRSSVWNRVLYTLINTKVPPWMSKSNTVDIQTTSWK